MEHSKKNRWVALAALGVAGAAFLVIALGGIGENLVYYWGPKQIREAGGKAVGATIRLGGQVVPGSIRTGGVSSLEFDVTDGEALVRVRSNGVPPQMFREGIGVVVEGTMTPGGWFESQRLMVSHGNEYQAPGEEGPADVRELMKTTEGLPAVESGR
ncbi:MAG TPA: cytochrome c maturation protein CcmE [Thermoanaerobaculia bacterium]|nr:cytochrome c maturation protein CcmE [Thermoanaerobaculia bacterium]